MASPDRKSSPNCTKWHGQNSITQRIDCRPGMQYSPGDETIAHFVSQPGEMSGVVAVRSNRPGRPSVSTALLILPKTPVPLAMYLMAPKLRRHRYQFIAPYNTNFTQFGFGSAPISTHTEKGEHSTPCNMAQPLWIPVCSPDAVARSGAAAGS